jgi:hypothetical protein
VGQGLKAAAEAVAASPVGAAVGSLKGVRDRYVESWETSQHPLVVSSSYVVDSVLAETEHGRAVRAMLQIDAGFSEHDFVQEMRDTFLPGLARAFLRHDLAALEKVCRETALAQCKSHQAARESAGIFRHDGVVLNVSQVNLMKATSLEQGVPVLLVSAMVQYINCARNKEVRACGSVGARSPLFPPSAHPRNRRRCGPLCDLRRSNSAQERLPGGPALWPRARSRHALRPHGVFATAPPPCIVCSLARLLAPDR